MLNEDERTLEYLMQFQHPEKTLATMPGVGPAVAAALFELSETEYAQWQETFRLRVAEAAEELLQDAEFARAVAALPFESGQTVVGLGDSITDYSESWFEILRVCLERVAPERRLQFLNMGISGDTTANAISRFLGVVMAEPDWILCMIGTNDCRLHGQRPIKTLVSWEETAKNLEMLVEFARAQTKARWVWMTPGWVNEASIEADPFLGRQWQLAWRNDDLRTVGDLIRQRPEPVIDLQEAFGAPAEVAPLLLCDGLHPSRPGHQRIVRAVVRALSSR